MKIGFDGKRATMNFRGLGNYSRGIVEGLLTYSSEELFLYTPSTQSPRAREWIHNIHNSHLHIRRPTTLWESKLNALWRSFSVAGDMKKDKLDLYHGLSHEIPFTASSMKMKKVVTIHDLIFLRYPQFFPLIDRITYKAKFKFACDKSDLVIAICQQTKNDLIELLGVDEKKIQVHYQSCDPVFYNPASIDQLTTLKKKYRLEKPFILTVGAFEDRKNQLSLIKSFASFSTTTDHDLVLIGNGKAYLQKCKSLVQELGLEKRIRFFSNISFKELPHFYQTADIFCFPSFFEGFGLPIVEALFSGTPVVTSLGSCFAESGGPDSLYADPHSVGDLADKLNLVLTNDELKRKMSSKGKIFVEQFHRQSSTTALLEHYRQLF